MQTPQRIKRLSGWAMALAAGLPLAGCTNTTSFSTLSTANVPTAAAVAGGQQAAAETLKVASTETGASIGSSESAAASAMAEKTASTAASTPPTTDAPAMPDPVAIPKPAPTASPTTLASVPRTPVVNRPTNQIMMVRTTAYTHSESDHLKYGRKSAAGNTLQYGSHTRSAAADWSKYPLGTRFMIEGLPYEYVVDDYGSALVGTETIDIYKPGKGPMTKRGVRNVPIRVLEWGSFEESQRILDSRKHVRHADHVREMLREIEKKAKTGQTSSSRRNV